MKTIQFHQATGMLAAVLEGRKTQVSLPIQDRFWIDEENNRWKYDEVHTDNEGFRYVIVAGEREYGNGHPNTFTLNILPEFEVGEVLAVAEPSLVLQPISELNKKKTKRELLFLLEVI